MAHFVRLDKNNTVIEVIVVNNNVLTDENRNENEQLGINFCRQLFGEETRWVQASYNGNFRKRYPALGDAYNETLDAFIIPKPYPSWILDENTCDWKAPIPIPEVPEEKLAMWNEDTLSWEIIDKPLFINN
jgi:hypothetical protein